VAFIILNKVTYNKKLFENQKGLRARGRSKEIGFDA